MSGATLIPDTRLPPLEGVSANPLFVLVELATPKNSIKKIEVALDIVYRGAMLTRLLIEVNPVFFAQEAIDIPHRTISLFDSPRIALVLRVGL